MLYAVFALGVCLGSAATFLGVGLAQECRR